MTKESLTDKLQKGILISDEADGLSDVGNPYFFTGRRLDTMDTGDLSLMYYRARAYDSETGRFMQQDPYGIVSNGDLNIVFNVIAQYTDGLNLMIYTKNNPVHGFDSWGLTTIYEYRDKGIFGHAGLLVDGQDIDYGPGINEYFGVCPWPYNNGISPDDLGTKYRNKLKMRKHGHMLWGPKKGIKCCKLKLRNAGICLKYGCAKWSGCLYNWGRTCRDFVRAGKNNCCLETDE